MTLEEKVDSMYQFLIKFQEQVNAHFQLLEEKVEAVYQLSMETAHFTQSVSDRLTVIEQKVGQIEHRLDTIGQDILALKMAYMNSKQGNTELSNDCNCLKSA